MIEEGRNNRVKNKTENNVGKEHSCDDLSFFLLSLVLRLVFASS